MLSINAQAVSKILSSELMVSYFTFLQRDDFLSIILLKADDLQNKKI